MKKRLALCIALILLLGLTTSCHLPPNTRMITGETFVEEAERIGLTVTDLMTEEYEDDYYNLYEATGDQIYVQYFYARDDMVANYLYTNDYNALQEKIPDSGANVNETTNSTFTKLAVTFPDGVRAVVVRSGGTYMYLESTAQGRAQLDEFLENISY